MINSAHSTWFENGPSPGVLDLQRRTPIKQHSHGIEVPCARSEMQAGLSVLVLGPQVRAFVQENSTTVVLPKSATPHKCGLDLLLREFALRYTGIIEDAADGIQPAQRRCRESSVPRVRRQASPRPVVGPRRARFAVRPQRDGSSIRRVRA